ncbi:Transcription factor [Niveomyces insectorum RCEF 264]|uniref:Transcription factor n=1 Tax=Niveomyces insectorum RCEF 264 TaxID=1081102 RepID=A0A167PTI9_9HYPO|nr:Transcription factor [Niveomyces insectorum RCEF 264]
MNYTFNLDGSDSDPAGADALPRDKCLQCEKRNVVCSIETGVPSERPHPPARRPLSVETHPGQSSTISPGLAVGGVGSSQTPEPESQTTQPEQPLQLALPSPPLPSPRADDSVVAANASQTSRFIGHLNPEARLIARTRHNSPSSDNDNDDDDERAEREERDHLGVWCRVPAPRHVAQPRPASASLLLQRYVNVIREFEIPDAAVCAALTDIYFATVHRFLPMVDEAAFRRDLAAGTVPIALLLAVLLAACRDSRAAPHLWFPSATDGRAGGSRRTPLQTREFAQRVYTHLASLLKAEAETDKVTLIQVHALVSLHCEGPSGNEAASLHLFTAIHYLQVLGMHLPRADETDTSGRFSIIFWSVWSLDRLNAAQYGRPTIIHEQDMANKAAFACADAAQRRRYAPFLVWLALTDLLDKTISYYRPGADPTCTGWEEGFPSFEEVLSGHDRDIPVQLLYVLEVYYHAVAILTSRFREWNPVTASNASSMRQALSTMRMLQMAQETPLADVSALPVIPYAMTLCMTVTYRQCRECLSSVVGRATKHLVTACTALDDLASKWWMAEAMAKLGRQALGKIARLEQQQQQKQAAAVGHTGNNNNNNDNNSRQIPLVAAPGAPARPPFTGDGDAAPIEDIVAAPIDIDGATAAEAAKALAGTTARSAPAVDSDNSIEIDAGPSRRASLGISLVPSAAPAAAAAAGPLIYPEWGAQLNVTDSDRNNGGQENEFYDYFLLDSIPNLVYPETGLKDDLFDKVRLFDGFGMVL